MRKMFPSALVNASWNSCLTVFYKTLCPIFFCTLTHLSGTRESDNTHTQLSALLCAHNSPLFLLPEAINVEKRFCNIEQEQIKPTWNQKK